VSGALRRTGQVASDSELGSIDEQAEAIMLKKLLGYPQAPSVEGLARAFIRLGRIGFWTQVVLGSIPVILIGYTFVFARSPSGPRAGLAIVEYLTIASLLLLLFTTLWFWRYVRLGRDLADPVGRPSPAAVFGRVWTGLVASSLGVALSLTIMLVEVAHLLFYFLATPQGGVPVFQTTGAGPASWVSAVDMLSLMALLLALAAEVVVLVFGLWLLFRTMRDYPENDG
jgi:Protein of unknown function (DUF3611)